MSRSTASDEGFTLIEMILSILILGLILGPFTGAIFALIQNTSFTLDRAGPSRGTTQDRIASAADARRTGAYFASDVQNSATITTTKPSCATPIAGDVALSVLTLGWPESSGGAVDQANYAWYYVSRPAKADGSADMSKLAELRRASCSTDISSPPVILATKDIVLARSVGPNNPDIACDGSSIAACSSTTRLITMRVGLDRASSVSYVVQGHRRIVTGP